MDELSHCIPQQWSYSLQTWLSVLSPVIDGFFIRYISRIKVLSRVLHAGDEKAVGEGNIGLPPIRLDFKR